MPRTNGNGNEAVTIPQRLLTLPEAAHYLGCTLWSIRELIWKGQLPYTRFGKRFQVDVRDLDALVEREKRFEGKAFVGISCVERLTESPVASHSNRTESIDLTEEQDETGELKEKRQRGKVRI
jgi:excisionase family DNA binding protein